MAIGATSAGFHVHTSHLIVGLSERDHELTTQLSELERKHEIEREAEADVRQYVTGQLDELAQRIDALRSQQDGER